MSITVANTGGGITQNTWTKSLTTAVSPIFRGTGVGGNPAAYEYMFEFRVGAAPNPFTVVQSWGQANTWTMPIDQVAGTYAVRVSARNGPNVVPRTATRNYTVAVPAPVATLALASVPATSPQLFGTAVAFTATPTGGAAAKQYQYSLSSDAGLTWTVVQAWNGTATGNLWTMPATTPAGDYLVKAEVRTNATAIDATAQLPFSIRNPAATGVTLKPRDWSDQPRPGTGQLPRHRPGAGSPVGRDRRRVFLPVPGRRSGKAAVQHEPRVHAAGRNAGRNLRP